MALKTCFLEAALILCNTTTTSKQTLLLHADGKKHRAKAKAFHAAQKQENKPEESAPKTDGAKGNPRVDSSETKNKENPDEIRGNYIQRDLSATIAVEEKGLLKKRKNDTFKHIEAGNQVDCNNVTDMVNGEVIQSNEKEEKSSKKRKKYADSMSHIEAQKVNGHAEKVSDERIKWKKLIISILKSNSDGILKVKKLQKLAMKTLQDSGVSEDKELLKKRIMDKIS